MDTNVLVGALRSNRGASYRFLSLIDSGAFRLNISVPLVLEYEDAAKRLMGEIPLVGEEIDDIIDYICLSATHQTVHYLWRPFLRDPKDDMVLEVAVTGQCSSIVTFNKRDFKNVGQFGLQVVTPREFLQEIGELT